MARNKKYTDRELIEDKKFIAEIYLESETYDTKLILERIHYFWPDETEWFYILHDKDKWTEDDVIDFKIKNKCEPPFVSGQEKKPHYHFVVKLPYSITLGNAAQKFGIPSQYVQVCKSEKAQVQYLIHQNHPNKYQYNKDAIYTNVNEKRLRELMKKDLESVEKASILMDYIELGCRSIRDLAQYALISGCWDELRRGQHLYTALINERKFNNESKSSWNSES